VSPPVISGVTGELTTAIAPAPDVIVQIGCNTNAR
jgi:hypothetical protein